MTKLTGHGPGRLKPSIGRDQEPRAITRPAATAVSLPLTRYLIPTSNTTNAAATKKKNPGTRVGAHIPADGERHIGGADERKQAFTNPRSDVAGTIAKVTAEDADQGDVPASRPRSLVALALKLPVTTTASQAVMKHALPPGDAFGVVLRGSVGSSAHGRDTSGRRASSHPLLSAPHFPCRRELKPNRLAFTDSVGASGCVRLRPRWDSNPH